MSWKDRLTRPRWEHKDPTVRARAIAELDDPRMARALPDIIESDPDAGVRLQALRRLDDESLWLRRAEQDSDDEIRAAADQRMLRYLRRPAADRDALAARQAWLERQSDPRRLQSLAEHAADPALRRAALERVNAQGFLGDRVVADPDDAISDFALRRIDQVSTLKRIAERLRKRNKKRYQKVLVRLDALEPDHDGGSHASAEAVCRAAEVLARGEWHGDRAERREELQQQWEAVGTHASETQQRRFHGAMEIVGRAARARPAAGPDTTTASAALHRLLEADDATAARRSLDSLLGGMDEAARTALGELIEQVESHLAALDATPHQALTRLARTVTGLRDTPEPPPAERIETLTSQWDRAWNRLDHPTQADQALKTEVMGALAVLRERLQTIQAAPTKTENRARSAIDPVPLLDQAEAALDNGELVRARKRLDAARGALGSRRGGPSTRLGQLEGRLKEMRDWQHWSNNRIRERLIREVSALPEAGHHPDAIVAKLKEARKQWQDLEEAEHFPGDKRAHAAPPGLWRKFQAACHTAHESAQPFFEKRHEIQARHKAEIDELIARADQLGSNSPPGTLRKTLRQARQAIRRLDEIPPADRSRTAKRLRGVMDTLGGHLAALDAEVEKTKLKLINEARQLAHESDRRTATDKAKSLQKQWQAAGSLDRKREQKLWQQFREPIDPLFEHEKSEREAQTAQRRAQDEQARAVIDEFSTLLDRPDAELDDQAGPVAGLESRWRELAVDDRRLHETFQARIDEFNRRREAARRARRHDRWNALVACGELLQQAYEHRLEGKPEGKERTTLINRWQSLVEQSGQVAPDLLANLLDASEDPATADEDSVRGLLVELEFLAGLPSPEADHKRRMDYQVRRLSSRLGGSGELPDPEREFEALLHRWLETLPLDPEAYTSLQKRFNKAVKALQKELIT